MIEVCHVNSSTAQNARVSGNYVYIGRPSKWGNPFRIGVHGDRERVILLFREYIEKKPRLRARAKKELRGKVLGCYCSPLPCHGDVWKEIVDD